MFRKYQLVPLGGRANSHRKSLGFSLIEMLCTMAILLILFVLMWGRGASGFQKQQKAACRRNLLTLYMALDLDATENKESYPALKEAESSEGQLSLLVPRSTTTL